MFHTTLVVTHIVGAVGALITGFWALNAPNGTPRHRRLGKTYLLMWALLAGAGLIIGLGRPGITIFEVLNVLGFGTVAMAYRAVLLRKRIGHAWLQKHYKWMVNSLAFLVIATINQVLPRMGIEYPIWVFLLMVASPSLIIPFYVRRLDRRYGFVEPRAVRTTKKEHTAPGEA
jgi:uncharacterized membrane protein